MADVFDRTIADLAAHPDGTTAGQIGFRIDVHSHIVFQVLETLERDGLAQRTRERRARAWRWEPVTPPGGEVRT